MVPSSHADILDMACVTMDGDRHPPPSTAPGDSTIAPQTGELAKTAEAIWRAGVAAVDSSRLVRDHVQRQGTQLDVCGEVFDLAQPGRVIVVGAGKAGAGMARGFEQALGSDLPDAQIMHGWINVPADCVGPLKRIHLHAARPAGVNEPTEAGVVGSRRILELVTSMTERDLCVVLLSGGGSALLPLPIDGISLADKQTVTRWLSRSGATIQELNAVRKRLSRIKGGGLARAAGAGRMVALIISDVIGDPLDVIASGPTVDDPGTAAEALAILERMGANQPPVTNDNGQRTQVGDPVPQSIWNVLRAQAAVAQSRPKPRVDCRNCIIGNNETALNAAIRAATARGFDVRSLGSGRQGIARVVGNELAERCLAARREASPQPICFIGGGEPVVNLAATDRQRVGGRNQELALAACCRLWKEDLRGIAILSGGTDGEDGPTDAAGAVCDERVRDTARQLGLDPFDALSINDSHTFFENAGGLLKTGPTHTNVMDLQLAIVMPSSTAS
jgi:glycerate 2-kinase